MSTVKLDRARPYALIRGDALARYLQEGNYYDFYGKLCGSAPETFRAVRKTPRKPVARAKEEVSAAEALSRAAAKLDLGRGTAPDNLEQAAKENAKALAAEENV